MEPGYLSDEVFERFRFSCYLKMGNWMVALEGINSRTIPLIMQYHGKATESDRNWYKVGGTLFSKQQPSCYVVFLDFGNLKSQIDD